MRVPTIISTAVAAVLAGCGEQPRPTSTAAEQPRSASGAPGVETPAKGIYRAPPRGDANAPPIRARANLTQCGRYVAAPRGPGDLPEPQYCAEIVTDLLQRRRDMSGDDCVRLLIQTSRPLTAQDRAEGTRTKSGRIVDVEAAYRRAGLGAMWDKAERRMREAEGR